MAKTVADKFLTFGSGALAAPTSIKTSIATAVSIQTYNGAALNGAVGAAAFTCPRVVTATLSASAGAYTAASSITVTGTDQFGAAISDTLAIAGTGGGVTISSVKFFSSVTQIVIAAQANTAGSFTFGQSDAAVNATQLRVGTACNLDLKCKDGTLGTIYSVQVGEQVPVGVAIVFATSTAQGITAYV